ncbi:hypothetical protein [Calothrix sp. FACHB-168]
MPTLRIHVGFRKASTQPTSVNVGCVVAQRNAPTHHQKFKVR